MAISANELRIGNWFKNGNSYHKSTGVLNKGSYYKSISGHGDVFAYYEALEPIPLTEEILLKCGFEIKDIGAEQYFELVFDKSNIKFLFTRGLLYVGFCGIGQYHFNNKSIQYLHQLQNLYYALTGTELNINLLCK